MGFSRKLRRKRLRRLVNNVATVSALTATMTAGVAVAAQSPASACSVYPDQVPWPQHSWNADWEMDGERTVWWSLPSDGQRAIVSDWFIPAGDVSLPGPLQSDVIDWATGALQWVLNANGGYLQIKAVGDGRGFNRWFDPDDSRAYVVQDVEDGYGFLYSNDSTMRFNWVYWFYTQTVYNQSFDSRQVQYGWHASQEGWVYNDWLNGSDLRLRVNLRVGIPGANWFAHTIDQQFAYRRTDGSFPYVEGDGFPAEEVYVYEGCSGNWWGFTKNAQSISNLADPQDFSYDYPVNCTPSCK